MYKAFLHLSIQMLKMNAKSKRIVNLRNEIPFAILKNSFILCFIFTLTLYILYNQDCFEIDIV